jgi:hypothetical protein
VDHQGRGVHLEPGVVRRVTRLPGSAPDLQPVGTFVTASRTAALAGTFTGPATEDDTIVFHSDGTTIVHGQGTCACTVDGASGTFSYRIESSGTFPTSVSGQYAGQGSGGLASLHAEGPFSGNFAAVAYGGQVHFG